MSSPAVERGSLQVESEAEGAPEAWPHRVVGCWSVVGAGRLRLPTGNVGSRPFHSATGRSLPRFPPRRAIRRSRGVRAARGHDDGPRARLLAGAPPRHEGDPAHPRPRQRVREPPLASPRPVRRVPRTRQCRRSPCAAARRSESHCRSTAHRPDIGAPVLNVSLAADNDDRLMSHLNSRGPPTGSLTVAALRVDAAQRTRELFGADRLGEVVVHTGREAGLAVLEHRVCRHGDDAGTGLGRPALGDSP